MTQSPTGATLGEALAFLDRNPGAKAVDIVLTDLHGIARGKMIRRHELEALYTSGRGMPASLFAQDVAGHDVEAALLTFDDGGGDSRCWPVPGTLGLNPASGRGMVLLQMFDGSGAPVAHDPRGAMMAQIARAEDMGFRPKGAMELEFYLIDAERDAQGRVQPVNMPLGGRRINTTNCMSVDELDEMSPFFEAVYDAADAFDLPMESLISEYAEGQFELTLRYRDLARAADDIILTKQLLKTTARRFGMAVCFMAKPFGDRSGSGMHMHLSLTDKEGKNCFGDTPEGALSPLMLQAIGGIRATMTDSLLLLAPVLNSWRRFASTVYSPASNTWGQEHRNVALRIPESSPAARHLEHRVAGVDANPYLLAACVLGSALDGIEKGAEPGLPGMDGDVGYPPLPRHWLEAIESFESSASIKRILGAPLHGALTAVKRAEYEALAVHVTDVEWSLYGASL